MNQTIRVLEVTKGILETEGWIKNALHREGEGYCLVGGLDEAARLLGCSDMSAYTVLHELVGADDRGIAPWNNAPERIKGEVLELLDRGIEVVRQREALEDEQDKSAINF